MRIASKSVIGLVNSNGLERYKVTLLEFRVLLFGVACRSRHDRSHDPQISGAKTPLNPAFSQAKVEALACRFAA